MGLKFKFIFVTIVFSSFIISAANATWQGPSEIISGTWGSNNDQFAIEYGDTNDVFGGPFYILLDGSVIVTDIKNGRRKIYNTNSVITKLVKCIKSQTGVWNEECRIPLANYIATTTDGNIWVGPVDTLKNQGFSLYSPTGQLIKTSTTKPAELGKFYSQSLGKSSYRLKVIYPDMTYQMTTPFDAEKYYRDKNNNVYFIIGYTATIKEAATDTDEDISVTTYDVHKYNSCSKKLGTLNLLPLQGLDANGDVEYEYGEAVVAPNGDVYTWKRTEDKYSIVKWTWVDDPNAPSGPDAPANLTVAASTTGLYLTWSASPQDPGCVSGYEVSRSTTSGGTFSVLTTTDKGVLNYNDTTADAGTTYYYKLRAKSGNNFSAYTAEASGKR